MQQTKTQKVTKKEFVKAWLEELRSGNYTPCYDEHLIYRGKYDPFGVACVTAVKLGIIPSVEEGQDLDGISCGAWFDDLFGESDPYVGSDGWRLGHLWDVKRLSFAEIADEIEESI